MFGLFYFVQGISEPTEGLISQPVKSLLKSWGRTATEITAFHFLISSPWYLKPVFGLLTDFVPLAGYRRKSYLTVASLAAAAMLLILYGTHLPPGSDNLLLWMLLIPTIGVAFSDVVIDALMVDTGQPLGLTGRFQSIQWGAIWGASILNGFIGGYLSQHGLQTTGFLICGTAVVLTLGLSLFAVHEQRVPNRPDFAAAGRSLWEAVTSPAVLPVALYLFLWSFNPFASTVQYLYMTGPLGFSEQFYGETNSYYAMASMIASLAYGLYCRRFSRLTLINTSIVCGILQTLAYYWMQDELSARLIVIAAGFTYSTGMMVQLDLAAQSCPPRVAGTAFALLMALSNLGMGLSTKVGGAWYDEWSATLDTRGAYLRLVWVGAAFTAGCWLLVPLLVRKPKAEQE